MGEIMSFPETVEEFMERYKMVDTKEIYSNGTEYVPIFRMRQWFEHISAEPKTGKWMPNNIDYEHEYFTCSHCKRSVPIPHYIGGVLYDFCPNCGADMRGEKNG